MLAIYLTLIDNEDDKKSFEDLYNQNRSKAYAIAFNILKNKALAEEACSEALKISIFLFQPLLTAIFKANLHLVSQKI